VAERVTLARVHRYADHFRETNTSYSVACQIDSFFGAVRLLLPQQDWQWLRQVKARLFAAAPSNSRRGPVITSLQLIDLGLELMAECSIEPGQAVRMADAIGEDLLPLPRNGSSIPARIAAAVDHHNGYNLAPG
jgi:hypothetical protein